MKMEEFFFLLFKTLCIFLFGYHVLSTCSSISAARAPRARRVGSGRESNGHVRRRPHKEPADARTETPVISPAVTRMKNFFFFYFFWLMKKKCLNQLIKPVMYLRFQITCWCQRGPRAGTRENLHLT